jgi:hypothetical protein
MSIEAYPSPNGVLTSLIWRKTMSGGETSLSGYDNASQALSYTPGQEQVYLNGILLVRGDDYTATNGTSITGLSALAASDFIQVNCYNNFSVASVPSQNITGTIANNQLQNSAITINGSAISLGGSVTLAGDIESVTAGTGLTGGGSSGALTLGLSTPVATTNGGTGLSTFTTGDLVYASGADTLAKRSIGTTGQVLTVSGGVPSWSTPATPSAGKILQVVNATYSTFFSTTSTSYVDSGPTLTITPTSATSTIYLIHNGNYTRQTSAGAVNIRIVRNGTAIKTYNSQFYGTSAGFWRGSIAITHMDSPATTSALTYKIQISNDQAEELRAQYNNEPSIITAFGEWSIVGHEYEGIQFLNCEPITKEEFEAGFAQYDAWKAEQDASKVLEKQALLERLGITEEEARLLLS